MGKRSEKHEQVEEEHRILFNIHEFLSHGVLTASELADRLKITNARLSQYTKLLMEQGFVAKQKAKNAKGKSILVFAIPGEKEVEFKRFVDSAKANVALKYLETPFGQELIKYITANKRVSRHQITENFKDVPYEMIDKIMTTMERAGIIDSEHITSDRGLKFLAEKMNK
ncbi:MAG: helix-turn-helix domain-containing protein [archaeon]